MNIVVLGSGGWGTAAAMLLSDNGHAVTLWSHDPKKAELLNETRENPLLKGVRIPERITVTRDLSSLASAEMVVFASPVYFWGLTSQIKAIIDRMYALRRQGFGAKECILLGAAGNREIPCCVFIPGGHH